MSHSIVFETKFIKLSNGNLLHLDRSGCNNDNAGRTRDDFKGKMYTPEEFAKKVEGYMASGRSEENTLKIGSRWTDLYGYGEHLLRMAGRAVSFDEFVAERLFYGERFDGVELYKPEEKFMTAEEFDKEFYNMLYGGKGFSYSTKTTELRTEDEIVQALENKEPVTFYVGKKYH